MDSNYDHTPESRDASLRNLRAVHPAHLADPDRYRRDGRPRKGFGKFVRRAAPVVGKFVKGAVLGVIDGIPGASQVLSTVTGPKKVNGYEPVTRLVTGWATVALVGMAFAMKLTGNVNGIELFAILRMIFGL